MRTSTAPAPDTAVPVPTNPTSPGGTTRSGERPEHVTATGWRLIGSAATLLARDVDTAALPVGRDEDVLYTARFRVRPLIGNGSPVPGIVAALGSAVARTWPEAPPLMPDRPRYRQPGRFQGLRWEPKRSESPGDPWHGELVWRHPHPVVAGAPCTTHVVILDQPGQCSLFIRVTADGGLASVRGTVGAGQARPALLDELARSHRLAFDGGTGEPVRLERSDVEAWVRNVLLSDERDYPVGVIAPLEEGGYAIPPADLAAELLGVARLYVIDRHETTFVLTDSLGDKRLSCYWGALRIYLPEFSCADRPESHPLLVRDRLLDPVMRASLLGTLGRSAARRVRMPELGSPSPRSSPREEGRPSERAAAAAEAAGHVLPAGADAPSFPSSGLPAGTGGTTPAVAEPAGGLPAIAPLLTALGQQIGSLAATITTLVDSNAALRDEIERLRTTTSIRAASLTGLERRLGGMERLLEQRLASPETAGAAPEQPEGATPHEDAGTDEADDVEALGIVEVVRQAATAHADALLVLESAERSAAGSPYEDADRLAVVLDAMAAMARRRQEGVLGTSLRAAFRELGIDYRGGIAPSTSERHRRQYLVSGPGGQVVDCREHIVLGNSYDPRYCLRIYFSSRVSMEPRFVIGHVGRHFDVASTT